MLANKKIVSTNINKKKLANINQKIVSTDVGKKISTINIGHKKTLPMSATKTLEIIFWSMLGRFFCRHQLEFFWLTSDDTIFLPTSTRIFLLTLAKTHHQPTLTKKNIVDVGQNIPQLTLIKKILVDVNKIYL